MNKGYNIIQTSCGIILLAAGASVRLGKPKQLLEYGGKPLLQHGLQVAIDSGLSPVIVVLGANADSIKTEISNKDITLIINDSWSEGMASSIRCGIEKLMGIAPDTTAAIIMVCDQPFVSSKLLIKLIKKHQETGLPVIASRYENNNGTPALFDKAIFASLLKLKGDTGAKKIMKESPDWVGFVDFPKGIVDIDTEEDYNRLAPPSQMEG